MCAPLLAIASHKVSHPLHAQFFKASGLIFLTPEHYMIRNSKWDFCDEAKLRTFYKENCHQVTDITSMQYREYRQNNAAKYCAQGVSFLYLIIVFSQTVSTTLSFSRLTQRLFVLKNLCLLISSKADLSSSGVMALSLRTSLPSLFLLAKCPPFLSDEVLSATYIQVLHWLPRVN